MAIERDRSHFKAFYNRAFCWDKVGNFEEAEKDYIEAVKMQSENISALHHLGTIREKIGGDRLSLALENFNTVLQLDPKYAPSFNGRGLVWDLFFNFEEAVKDFGEAIKLDKTNAVYWHNRASCYRNMGMLE
jgi:tetratricopeptide (TPR) repeat protein